jgi:uncharacterized protein YceK
MRKIAFAACLAVGTLLLGGCGTLCNFGAAVLPISDDGKVYPEVYGGVQFDVAVLTSSRDTPISSGGDVKGIGIIAACLLADVPASFIGDTLTLPITLALHRSRAEPNSPSRGNDATPVDPEMRARAPSTAMGNLGEPQQDTRPPSPQNLRLGNEAP